MLPQDSQKTYRQHTKHNFALGLLVTLLLVNTAFNWKFAHPIVDAPKDDIPITITTDEIEKVLPPLPEPKTVAAPKVLTPEAKIEIVDNDADLKKLAPVIKVDVDDNEPLAPLPFNPIDLIGAETSDVNDYTAAASPKEGMANFLNYVTQRVSYPDYLRQQGISGKVLVSFIIDEEGNISEVEIIESLHPRLDNQIKDIVKKAPTWLPAYQHGSPVKSRRILPINFRIQ